MVLVIKERNQRVTTDYFDTDDKQQLLGWFQGTVLDSFWSTDRVQSQGKSTYEGADITKLYWHVRVDDVLQEYDKMVPPTMTVSFGLGDKWFQDPDHPDYVRHEDDPGEEAIEKEGKKPILFKGSSLYGKFVGLCNGKYYSFHTQTPIDPLVGEPVVLDDGPEPEYDLAGVRGNFSQRGVTADPRTASIWIGMQFLFRGLGFPYRQTKGTPGFRATPVAFLGYDADASDSAPSGSEQAGEPIDPQVVAGTLPAHTEPALVDDLAKLVGSATSHTEFMKMALKMDNVKGDPEIKAAVMNSVDGPWSAK